MSHRGAALEAALEAASEWQSSSQRMQECWTVWLATVARHSVGRRAAGWPSHCMNLWQLDLQLYIATLVLLVHPPLPPALPLPHRRGFMVRILLSVLQFRVNARYVEANPPFTGIGELAGHHCWWGQGEGACCRGGSAAGPVLQTHWIDLPEPAPACKSLSDLPPQTVFPRPALPPELDISDSGREGCAVSTLTITSEPKDWRGAVQASSRVDPRGCLHYLHNVALCCCCPPFQPVSLGSAGASVSPPTPPTPCACPPPCPALNPNQVAIQEVRRLQRFGVTRGELERYKTALLRDRWAGCVGALCHCVGWAIRLWAARLVRHSIIGTMQLDLGTACDPLALHEAVFAESSPRRSPSPLRPAAASSWLSRARACPAWTTWSL